MAAEITPAWKARFAPRAQRMKASAIRELLAITAQPDVISFAGGLPAQEALPVEQLAVATEAVLRRYGGKALQYGETEGFFRLRQQIAAMFQTRGMTVDADNVLLTNGSQQGLDLVGRIFIDEHEPVLVESPTYLGALQAWQTLMPDYHSVDTDNDGVIVEQIASQPRFKLMYVIPNFQNPSGRTLTLARREALIPAIHSHDAILIEDDPYGELRYSGEAVPSLAEIEGRQLGARWNDEGRVIYLGTFSKTLAPGLRIGWVLAPASVVRIMTMAKQGIDLHTSTLSQMIISEMIDDRVLETNMSGLRNLYREKRDAMLAALDRHFSAYATWTKPDGGLFIWLKLNADLDTATLLAEALQHKVAYVPGASFYVDGDGGKNEMRLNFSSMSPARIEEGIARLAALIRETIAVITA